MSTGASVPTASRNEAVRAETCSADSTLRLNRIKPHGRVSRKNARSPAVSARPQTPLIKLYAVIGAGLHGGGGGGQHVIGRRVHPGTGSGDLIRGLDTGTGAGELIPGLGPASA